MCREQWLELPASRRGTYLAVERDVDRGGRVDQGEAALEQGREGVGLQHVGLDELEPVIAELLLERTQRRQASGVLQGPHAAADLEERRVARSARFRSVFGGGVGPAS